MKYLVLMRFAIHIMRLSTSSQLSTSFQTVHETLEAEELHQKEETTVNVFSVEEYTKDDFTTDVPSKDSGMSSQ